MNYCIMFITVNCLKRSDKYTHHLLWVKTMRFATQCIYVFLMNL